MIHLHHSDRAIARGGLNRARHETKGPAARYLRSHPPVFFDQRYYHQDRAFKDLKVAAREAKAAGVKPAERRRRARG